MRLEKRPHTSRLALLLAPVGAVLFTLLVSALLVWWAGAGVAQTYGLLLRGGFGSVFALSETFTRAIPLMLTGLAAAVAFRARLFNIGAEGQLYVGALAAVAVGGLHGGSGFDLPVPLLFGLMLLAAALAGALLLLGPALLKARLGVDEVVTTLLLNFIVLLLVSLMLDGPMKDPTAMGWPQSVALMGELELSKLVAQTRVHSGLLIAAGLYGGLVLAPPDYQQGDGFRQNVTSIKESISRIKPAVAFDFAKAVCTDFEGGLPPAYRCFGIVVSRQEHDGIRKDAYEPTRKRETRRPEKNAEILFP